MRNRSPMRVGMYTSVEERCGIATYSRGLIGALEGEAAVRVVAASFEPPGVGALGAAAGALNEMDVAHVQHSYAFFGGMGPGRMGARTLLTAIRRPLVVTV